MIDGLVSTSAVDSDGETQAVLKLENIFQHLFAAKLNLTIEDRFTQWPTKWFLVPLQVIDEAVEYLRNGPISQMTDDPKTGRMVSAGML